MATDDLPKDFDIIVLGTGLTETIVAAAFSRIGLKVLHIDRNDFYGGNYGNFNFDGMTKWVSKSQEQEESQGCVAEVSDKVLSLLSEGESALGLPLAAVQGHNISCKHHLRERTSEEQAAVEESQKKKHQSPAQQSPTDDTEHSSDPSEDSSSHQADPTHTEGDNLKTSEKESCDDVSKDSNLCFEKLSIEPSTVEVQSEKQGEEREKSFSHSQGDCSQVKADEAEAKEKGDSSQVKTDEVETNEKGDTTPAKTDEVEAKENMSEKEESAVKELTAGDLRDNWRRFCFDLSPKVVHCAGDMVELLIQSDVARYCEFRTVSRVLTKLNGSLQQVPCSRADVFNSKIVSLIEKRLMMKFLQFAADFQNHPEEYKDFENKTFIEFLKSKKLTANIQHFVQHAIAMVPDTASTQEGLEKTQKFLLSLGRYGNTAFLFPLYGTGELPQAFARLSAVFGGVYCLMVSATHIIFDTENKCTGIITSQGQKISCKYLVAESSYLPSSLFAVGSDRKLARAIYITDESISPSEDAELSLLNYVCKMDPERSVTVLELPHSAAVCPRNYFVVHLSRECTSDDPETEFEEIRNDLFAEGGPSATVQGKPHILWSMYFVQEDLSQVSLTPGAVDNVLVTSGSGSSQVDMDSCVHEARQIFKSVCPSEEFLPKPPNPEDIIHVDDTESTVAAGPSEFESAPSGVSEEMAQGEGKGEGQTNNEGTSKEGDESGKRQEDENEGKGEGQTNNEGTSEQGDESAKRQ